MTDLDRRYGRTARDAEHPYRLTGHESIRMILLGLLVFNAGVLAVATLLFALPALSAGWSGAAMLLPAVLIIAMISLFASGITMLVVGFPLARWLGRGLAAERRAWVHAIAHAFLAAILAAGAAVAVLAIMGLLDPRSSGLTALIIGIVAALAAGAAAWAWTRVADQPSQRVLRGPA